MPRPRFPQFEDGEKAARETARRLKRVAEIRARNNETIAREREALQRSRMLLTLARDPLQITRLADRAVAALPRRKPSRTKKKGKGTA